MREFVLINLNTITLHEYFNFDLTVRRLGKGNTVLFGRP